MSCEFTLPVPEPLRVRTPVGPVTGIPSGASPSQLDVSRGITSQLSALMAPLQGIFEIAEIAVLIIDTVKAIPSAISSLSPGKITGPLSKLTGKLPVLINLLPQFSGARLVKDTVEVIAANLNALRTELLELQRAVDGRASASVLAESLRDAGELGAAAALDETVGCLDTLRAERTASMSSSNTGIDALVELMNTVLDLVPGNIPKIPTLGAIPDDIGEAIEVIDTALEILNLTRRALGPI